ncbi:MAG TPA: ribonuclease H [Polyangiaceae bacterium]|nr:ribonuclease H [Polyangiaceae bacterium]
MSTYECQSCGKSFAVPQKTLDKYPSWQPKNCLSCHSATRPGGTRPTSRGRRPRPSASAASVAARSSAPERVLTLREVLETYTDGPATGIFTDGAAHPNPGPGGWGAVFVVDNEIIEEARGAEPQTTNNRMELRALLAGYALVPPGRAAVVMTDSQLCVDTINSWAADWERNGWKRRRGEIKNLDLVQELYRVAQARPEIELRWIKSHNGYRWNEYADALASAYRRATP